MLRGSILVVDDELKFDEVASGDVQFTSERLRKPMNDTESRSLTFLDND